MKKIFPAIVILAFGLASYGQEELKTWTEFLTLVKNHQVTENMIKPLDQLGDHFKPVLLGYLDTIRNQASASDWLAIPETFKTGNRLQFLVPWTSNGKRINYCFSFVTDSSGWFFQHLETIFIRLDSIPALPVSTFPDITEEQKAWIREEFYWSFIISNIYLPVSEAKSREYALSLLKDGGGYFVAAKAWVPFTSPRKAFILFVCWEQANLRGNRVTLNMLKDNEASITLKTQYFELYSTAAHLTPLISLDDYKQIFETIWLDRASNAGWDLNIRYSEDNTVTFNFSRNPEFR